MNPEDQSQESSSAEKAEKRNRQWHFCIPNASTFRKASVWIRLFVLIIAVITASAASAQLARVGPINAGNGYPEWYQDKSGLTMEFCRNLNQSELDGGWCLLLPADVPSGRAPEAFPNNFAEEHFYWAINSGIRKVPIPGTDQTTVILLVGGLEGAFATGPVIPGDQMVFARVRIKINPVPYDGTYTVYTPFGKFVFPDQLANQARGIFFTEDIGLAPGNFTDALGGRVGPFLLPSATPGGAEVPAIPDLAPGQDPFYDALVAVGGATPYPNTGKRYLADPGRIGPITGSPLPDFVVGDGTTRNPNIFRVEGPNGFVFESTDFSIMGRVFEGPITGQLTVDRASYARSDTATRVDVYATAFPGVQGRLPAGPPSATVSTQLSYFDAPCAATLDAAGNPGPPYTAPAGAVANQMFASGSNYFGQSAPATIPPEVCVQANAVTANGQTVTSFVPALLGDQVFITEALYDPQSQSLSVKATSSDQLVAKTLTVEGLGTIDLASGQLLVNPVLAPPASVIVLSSGSGRNELQVSTGAVAGGGAATLPVAVNDTASTIEDTATTINVLANDTSAAGGSVAIVSPPVLGTAVVNADGSIAYTPKLNANGTDSFTYHVTVGTQVSNEASVTVSITPVNDPPVAINDSAGALRGFSNSINVLANDFDPDGAADLAAAVIVTGNASLGIEAGAVFPGGVVTFTPLSTASAGVYTFTYNAVDQSGVPSATPATVTVNLATTEAIIPQKGIYTQSKGRWVITGTVSPIAGQTMTITYVDGTYKVNGSCIGNAANTLIGTAVVDASGTWLYDQILNSTTGVLNPSNTGGNSSGFWCSPPKSLRVSSSLTGASVTTGITLK